MAETIVDGGVSVHFEHSVDVDVKTTVEIVLIVDTMIEAPDVDVNVTGQVVSVV